MKCPFCNFKFGIMFSNKFTRGFGTRKVVPCPHCDTNLILSKLPHIIKQIGLILFLIITIVPFTPLILILREANWMMSSYIFFVASTLIILIGSYLSQRLETVNKLK
jgi:hypothetical protein